MSREMEEITDKVNELSKTETGVSLEILKLIAALARAIDSESTSRMFSGASGHGY